MAVELITDFRELMRLAHAEGQAKLAGDPVALAAAVAAHDAYKALCLKSERMNLGVTVGALG